MLGSLTSFLIEQHSCHFFHSFYFTRGRALFNYFRALVHVDHLGSPVHHGFFRNNRLYCSWCHTDHVEGCLGRSSSLEESLDGLLGRDHGRCLRLLLLPCGLRCSDLLLLSILRFLDDRLLGGDLNRRLLCLLSQGYLLLLLERQLGRGFLVWHRCLLDLEAAALIKNEAFIGASGRVVHIS